MGQYEIIPFIILIASTLLLFLITFYYLRNHVNKKIRKSILLDLEFKSVINQLANAKEIQEVIEITQSFFQKSFSTSYNKFSFIFHDEDMAHFNTSDETMQLRYIEGFFHYYTNEIQHLAPQDIFIFNDDFYHYCQNSFSNFYFIEPFFKSITAEILLPIYYNKTIIAYITICKNSREKSFTKEEQTVMLLFVSYLGTIINNLHQEDQSHTISDDIQTLEHKNRAIEKELKQTQRELKKEKFDNLFRYANGKTMGVIYYKDGEFSYANDEADKIIKIDLNTDHDHPLTQVFNHVVEHIETHKKPYSYYTDTIDGNLLILTGNFYAEKNVILITAAQPDLTDIIIEQLPQLHMKRDNDNDIDIDILVDMNSDQQGIA